MKTYKITCDHFGAEDIDYKFRDTPYPDLVVKDYVSNAFWDEPSDSMLNTSIMVTLDGVEYIVDIEPAIDLYVRKVESK